MHRIIAILLASAGLSIGVLAQEGERPPGFLKPQRQIDAELERSALALGVVAGRSTQVIATGPVRLTGR